MSNYLAVATVTATLRNKLAQALSLQDDIQGAVVRVGRPAQSIEQTRPTVNLYLFQVTRNAAFRDADLPTRTGDGTLTRRPQVALNLNYMLTFYGDESSYEPERLLGKTVSYVHARPVLTRQDIDAVVSQNQRVLGDSDLANQIEQVKFTPIYMDLDEIHRAWSVFFQLPYTLSVFYQASVVLITADDQPSQVCTVTDPRVTVQPNMANSDDSRRMN